MFKNKLTLLVVLLAGLVFVGAGCGGNQKPVQTPPGGAYFSSDGGSTWQQISNYENGGNITRVTPLRVVLDPFDPTVVYMASGSTGLLRYSRATNLWQTVITPAATVNGVVIHPRNPNIVFVFGNSAEATKRSKIWKSYDRGVTWNEIYADPVVRKAGFTLFGAKAAPSQVAAMDVDPARPEVVLVGSNSGALIISNDGGATWRNANSLSRQVLGIKALPGGNKWFILLSGGKLMSSVDDGKTLEDVSVKTENSGSASAILGLQFYLENDEVKAIFAGTDRGVYRSEDGGVSWNAVPLPISERQYVSVDALAVTSPNQIYAGSNYVLYTSRNNGTNWKVFQFNISNPIKSLVVDPSNPNNVYAFFVPR